MKLQSKRRLFQLGFIGVACLLLEVALRAMGYAPGDLRPNWLYFQPVDTLQVIRDFYTRNDGIMVAAADYWQQKGVAINADGFRGKEMDSSATSAKKKILFIGDSFTWGMSASPFSDSSFCDLLAKNTPYEIINTGIPVADPPQYAAIAEQYIPKLKPDYVLLVFFMGNDLMREDRPIVPGEQIFYWTNAGGIMARMDGRHYPNAQQAYSYLVNHKYFLKQPETLFEKVVAKSALLSRLYAGKFRVEEKVQYEKARNNAVVTTTYLARAKAAAAKQGVPFKIVLIPERKEADMDTGKYIRRYQSVLGGQGLTQADWLIWPNAPDNFTPYPDAHLNNRGHRYYALQLQAFLDETVGTR